MYSTLSENAIPTADPGTTRWDGMVRHFGLRTTPAEAKSFIVLLGSGRRLHPWALGYCFAVFETLAQRAEFDEEDQTLLVRIGFHNLFGKGTGQQIFKKARDHKDDEAFLRGRTEGRSDINQWRDQEAFQPLALQRYFVFGIT